MKKIFILFFIFSISNASVIDNVVKEEQKFGEWTINCTEDVMFGNKHCKIWTDFYDTTSKIFVQPNNKNANQVVFILPKAIENGVVMVRVDKNAIINSDPVDKKNKYGIVPFSPKKQKTLLQQMKAGNEMLIRFNINNSREIGGIQEITTKISLLDFNKMIIYYNDNIRGN
ncbi:MAG: hypothetical protein Ta2D_05220 [Rickettsiales bacterium]|nr:MAG: hypothetical protein Ta2D_05220 [Rickettsiales bacterium]